MSGFAIVNGGGARVGDLTPSVSNDGLKHSLNDPHSHLELVRV